MSQITVTATTDVRGGETVYDIEADRDGNIQTFSKTKSEVKALRRRHTVEAEYMLAKLQWLVIKPATPAVIQQLKDDLRQAQHLVQDIRAAQERMT